MASTVLIVEDDSRIRETTRLLLEDYGFAVADVPSAERCLEKFDVIAPDCVLVDLMLPGMDGFDCCRALRQRSGVPIIVLTARSDSFDVVAGLEAGADDYITKPFQARELQARIEAAVRRASGAPKAPPTIKSGSLEVAPEGGVVTKNGEPIPLTKTEFRLLCQLAANPGRVFTREILLEQIWGYTFPGDGKMVDTHIHRLRAKLEDDPARPEFVLTVRGLGYKFAAH